MYFEKMCINGVIVVRARDCAKFLDLRVKEIAEYYFAGCYWLSASTALQLLKNESVARSTGWSPTALHTYIAFKQLCTKYA